MRRISKKVRVTFSIPEEVNDLLHSTVGNRGLSEFATKALQKALVEEKDSLKKDYAAANQDSDRNAVIDDWSILDNAAN